jgi:hypothetical protein
MAWDRRNSHKLEVLQVDVPFRRQRLHQGFVYPQAPGPSLDSVPTVKLGCRRWDENDRRHQTLRQSIIQKSPLRNAVMVEIWLEKLDSLSSIYNFRSRKTLCKRGGGGGGADEDILYWG